MNAKELIEQAANGADPRRLVEARDIGTVTKDLENIVHKMDEDTLKARRLLIEMGKTADAQQFTKWIKQLSEKFEDVEGGLVEMKQLLNKPAF